MARAAGRGKRKTARLRALAAVAAARAENGAEIALPAHGHALRAVDEDLQLDGAGPVDGRDLRQGQLPREHHAPEPGPAKRLRPRGGVDARLGGGVQPKPRRAGAEQPRKAHILHQHGVHGQRAGGLRNPQGVRQLAVRQKRIEREIDPHAARVAVPDGRRQIPGVEVAGPRAGAEPPDAEVDGVRAGPHGRGDAFRRAGRREDFRLTYHRSFFQRSS